MKFPRRSLRLIQAATFLALLVMGLFGGMLFGDISVSQASHGPCDTNDIYLHVHWFRSSSASVHDVVYDIDIIDESGATGVYEDLITANISEWNNEQGFVNFTTTGNLDLTITVDDYGNTTWMGRVTSSPWVCTNITTHLGTADMEINSAEIESFPVSERAHRRHVTAAHELGHSTGLSHTEDVDTIMLYLYDDDQPWGPVQADIDHLDGQSDPYGHLH